MKLLIETDKELKAFTGVSVALSIESVAPHLTQSDAEDEVISILGTDLYNALRSAYNGGSMTAAQKALLPYAQKPLAALAVYHYLQEGGVHISDAGVTTDRDKAAYQWQQDKVEHHYLRAAYKGLDRLIGFLLAHRDDYDWSGSAYAQREQGAVIPSAEILNRYVNVNKSYRTYRALLPLLEQGEAVHLRPLLGAALLDALKANIKDDNLSAADKDLLHYARPALANLAMAAALQDLNMEITGDGAYLHSLRAQSQANVKEREKPHTSDLARAAERFGGRGQNWLEQLRQFLNEKASSTLYASYYASDAYTDPQEPQTYEQDSNTNLYNAL